MKTTRRRALLAAGALAVTALLGGCASIPTDGPVQRVAASGEPSASSQYVINASGPVSGASAEEIVRGFIAAGADARESYATARKYLTAAAAASWQPERAVQVVENLSAAAPQAQSDGSTAVAVSAHQIGAVDGNGVYAHTDAAVQISFGLEQVDGQWRIDAVPIGTMISRGNFQLVFAPRSLAFLTPARDALVADVRWFPAGTSTSTRVVSALLQGPSNGFEGAVTTAFPAGTRLSIDSVVTTGETTTVSLTPEALNTGERERQLMYAQLAATVAEVPGTGTVRVMVNNTEQRRPADTDLVGWPQLRVSSVLAWGTDGIAPLDGSAGKGALRDVLGVLPRGGSGAFAVSGSAGAVLGSQQVRFASRTALSSPQPAAGAQSVQLDGSGWAWWADGRGVRAATSAGGAVDLSGDRAFTRFALAPDGIRAAYLVATDAGTDVVFAAVRRSATGVPIALSDDQTVATLSGAPGALTWVGTSLAVSTDAGDASTVSVVNGAQVTTTMTPLGPITELAGGRSGDSLRALTTSGGVYSVRGTGWVRAADNVSHIAYAWR